MDYAAQEFDCATRKLSQRKISEALKLFHRAEQLGHVPHLCAARRWECYMLLGQFEQAWAESERISAEGVADPHSLWDGLPFSGKRVIVRCLHGFGDAIQFLRYARLVKGQASRVIVETHPEMVSLIETLPYVDDVITWARPHDIQRDDWDQQIEVMELPRAFRTSVDTIPAATPGFDIQAREAPRLRCAGSNPRVGLIWASSAWNPARSIPFAALLPLLETRGVSFFSFQRGKEREEMAGPICDATEGAPEILDTAKDFLELDLLITVDTMAAHLAGALGVPVWTLLPWEADWRWMLEREDTPWYPTMRLFRQPAPRAGWDGVIERAGVELRHALL